MITYNQGQFIEQAINSVLMQSVDFNFELIIGDDCSSDNTDIIINQIVKSHPKGASVKYTKHYKNKGMIPNFVWALGECNGKYIALLDGDDYWTDILKLQKQVDFLEVNASYSGVATNSKVIYEDIAKEPHLFRQFLKPVLKTCDLLTERPFHTATFMFRKKAYVSDFPTSILSADRALFLLISCFGNIGVLQETTAVYRKNKNGISRNVTSKQMMSDFKMVSYLKKYSRSINSYKLKAFIAYTVLEYSFKIGILDFIIASTRLVLNRIFHENPIKALKYSLQVIKRNKVKVFLRYE